MKQLVEHATFETATAQLHVIVYDTDRAQRYFASYVLSQVNGAAGTKGRRGLPIAYGSVEAATIAELDAACRQIAEKAGGRIVRERGQSIAAASPATA